MFVNEAALSILQALRCSSPVARTLPVAAAARSRPYPWRLSTHPGRVLGTSYDRDGDVVVVEVANLERRGGWSMDVLGDVLGINIRLTGPGVQ